MSVYRVDRTPITTGNGRYETVYSATSLDPSKPTLALVNSFATSVDMYSTQMAEAELTSAFNLIAIGLLGHEVEAKLLGPGQGFTFWDQADLVLAVMQELGVEKFYILGTSQGGFIGLRAAVRAPHRVQGLIACGSGFFQDLCDDAWNAKEEFSPPPEFFDWIFPLGWGLDAKPELLAFWKKSLLERYSGVDGGRRFFGALAELLDRDVMHNLMQHIKCPIWFLHGEKDVGIPPSLVKEQFAWVPSTVDARLEFVEGGAHFLSQSRPEAIKEYVLEFHKKYCV
ncbi:hydrolase [Pseudohyphozyma bogoriensis]|nr:hydrolase [Pseudohyphozyma bogoriensis]